MCRCVGNLLITISGGRVTAKILRILTWWLCHHNCMKSQASNDMFWPWWQVTKASSISDPSGDSGKAENQENCISAENCAHPPFWKLFKYASAQETSRTGEIKLITWVFLRKITYIKPHELETLLWMGRRHDVWKGLSDLTWFCKNSNVSESSSCRNSCNANTTCSKVCGCYSVRFLCSPSSTDQICVLRWLLH